MKVIIFGGEDVSARIDFSKYLIKNGIDVIIVGSEDDAIFHKNNLKYIKYGLHRTFNPFKDLLLLIEIYQIIKNNYSKDDIIQCYDTKPCFLVPISSFLISSVRIFRTITGMGQIFSSNAFISKLYRLIYLGLHYLIKNKVEITIFQNHYDKKYFIKNKLTRENNSIIIKGSGINIGKYNQDNVNHNEILKIKRKINFKNELTFVFAGRIIKEKGIVEYLEVAKMLSSKADFLLAGVIEDKSLEKLIYNNKHISYLGFRKDITNILKISDIFVLPSSYREGLPRGILEACSMGLAIITTDSPGCNEIVENNYNGIYVKKNDVNSLFKGAKYLIDDKNLINKFKSNSLIKINDFSNDKIFNDYKNIYNSISQ